MAFGWGGFAASHLAIPINTAIGSLAAKLGSPEFSAAWGPALAGPTSEETLKYLGVIVLVLIARTRFRTGTAGPRGACTRSSAPSCTC